VAGESGRRQPVLRRGRKPTGGASPGSIVAYPEAQRPSDDVLRAKPEPDLFLACQERMGVRREDCYVVGDAVWDLLAARRAGMLSVGLLSGGYGEDELTQAGAFRVYRDTQDLFDSLDELGVTLPR
jgi:phosphoglycolate phosphatase-like HAD superfamily hydrolase